MTAAVTSALRASRHSAARGAATSAGGGAAAGATPGARPQYHEAAAAPAIARVALLRVPCPVSPVARRFCLHLAKKGAFRVTKPNSCVVYMGKMVLMKWSIKFQQAGLPWHSGHLAGRVGPPHCEPRGVVFGEGK